MPSFVNLRTVIRAVLMGIGSWLITQPAPMHEIGTALMALAVTIGSGTAPAK